MRVLNNSGTLPSLPQHNLHFHNNSNINQAFPPSLPIHVLSHLLCSILSLLLLATMQVMSTTTSGAADLPDTKLGGNVKHLGKSVLHHKVCHHTCVLLLLCAYPQHMCLTSAQCTHTCTQQSRMVSKEMLLEPCMLDPGFTGTSQAAISEQGVGTWEQHT
jgi:hypothetical protein